MLYTNLNHIEGATAFNQIIQSNPNVVVICGRMGHPCISAYRIAGELESKYEHVKFYDMEFDHPCSFFFHHMHGLSAMCELPFLTYYRNGVVVATGSGFQDKNQAIAMLETVFAPEYQNNQNQSNQ